MSSNECHNKGEQCEVDTVGRQVKLSQQLQEKNHSRKFTKKPARKDKHRSSAKMSVMFQNNISLNVTSNLSIDTVFFETDGILKVSKYTKEISTDGAGLALNKNWPSSQVN